VQTLAKFMSSEVMSLTSWDGGKERHKPVTIIDSADALTAC